MVTCCFVHQVDVTHVSCGAWQKTFAHTSPPPQGRIWTGWATHPNKAELAAISRSADGGLGCFFIGGFSTRPRNQNGLPTSSWDTGETGIKPGQGVLETQLIAAFVGDRSGTSWGCCRALTGLVQERGNSAVAVVIDVLIANGCLPRMSGRSSHGEEETRGA